ncbi:hypothetical protein GQ457_07G006860 [Hibiscus cannabinus]
MLDGLQKELVMQFLMGLNESFAPVRGRIVLMDPMPSITKVFSLVIQEENQHSMTISNPISEATFVVNASNPPKKSHPQCSYCSLLGHTKDKCYKLHGYPPGYKSRGVVSHANVALHGDKSIKNVDPLISQKVAGQSFQEKDDHSSHEIGCESTSLQVDPLISQEVDGQSFQAEAGHSFLESDPPALIPIQARKSSRITQRPSYLKEYFCNVVVTSKEDGASCTYPIEDYIANTRLTPSYSTFVANISSTYEPSFFHQEVKIPERRVAMDEELKAMESLQTWSVVPLPAGKKAIPCKWVYRIKRKADGTIDRYKARLVAKGFTQIKGIDFIDTFSPVAKMTSFKVLLALAAVYDWNLLQLDVNNVF